MIEIKRTGASHELKLDEAGHIVLAFAQLNVVDRDRDVTIPGAFPAKDVPMSAYGHSSWNGALPVGRGAIAEKGSWAVFEGDFLMETDHGRNAYHTVKAMAELQEYSYGYEPTEYSFGEQDGQRVRFLKRLDVFEVSPVLVGAGLGTHTQSIKSGEPGIGLPYVDHLEALLREAAVFMDRSRDRADFRAKEGRSLSAATTERLAALKGAIASVGVDIDALLADAAPKARLDGVALAELLRSNGVRIG